MSPGRWNDSDAVLFGLAHARNCVLMKLAENLQMGNNSVSVFREFRLRTQCHIALLKSVLKDAPSGSPV